MTTPIELFDAYLDGSLSDDQSQQLRDYIDQSPEQVKVFVRAVCMDQALYDLNARSDESETMAIATAPRRMSHRIVAALAMAAAIALAVTLWIAWPARDAPMRDDKPRVSASVALLTNTIHAVFAGGHAPAELGGEMPPGMLRLESGVAQVMFNSGAVVDLTGPCTFDMTEPNRGRLLAGAIEAYVPLSARGFTVDVRDTLRVIDLGTRFRLAAETDRVQVQVDQGRVQVIRLDASGRAIESHMLAAASMASLSGDSLTLGDYTPAHQRQNRYINALQLDAPAMYWPFGAEPGQTAWVDMGPAMLDAAFNDGATVIADGPLGDPALRLAGTDELEAGARRDGLVTTAPLTVETWLRLDRNAHPASIVLTSPGGRDFGWELGLVNRDDQLRLALDVFGQHRYRFDQVSLDADRWMHLAVVLDDAGVARCYLDGQLVQSLIGPPPHDRKPNTVVVKIGGWAAGPFFRGDLAHLAIYDRALEADRILRHFDQASHQ